MRSLKLQDKRSKWKTQFDLVESASSFHNKLRDIFVSDPFFRHLHCFQEVPVSSIVLGYQHTNHHVDWYIDELGTVIELHGKQHYNIANFGNDPYDKARATFHNIQYRDNLKKIAIQEAGIEYREISYKLSAELNANMIKDIIFTETKNE